MDSASSRREWLMQALGALGLSGFYYRDYSTCLPDYLRSLAQRAYEDRNRALSLLTSPETVRNRQAWARATLWKLIGGEPQRTPLQARVIERLERPSYSVEKLIYESRPRVVISANLYIPKRAEMPCPGILFQMGHSELGKAYAPYQKCCQGLVQLGFVVLAFDPMGQGERIAYPDMSGVNTRLPSVDDEHSVPGKQMLLVGDTATRYQLWDAIRSLDYLASRPEVDPARLGTTGQSGGGTLSMLLACVDDRLSAAVVCSGNTENVACAEYNPPGATDDAEQDLIGSGGLGFDRWDLLYPFAPKPLLIQVSAHDFFGTYSPRYLSNGREEYEKLARVYKILGRADHLSWNSTPLPHGLSYELRLNVYNWFLRWLRGGDQTITSEPPVSPEAPKTLWAGVTGNVTRDFGSLLPIDLIRKQSAEVARSKRSLPLNDVLPIPKRKAVLRLAHLASTRLNGTRVEAVEVNTEPNIWVPAWLFSPAEPDPGKPVVIALDDRGRNREAHADGVYHKLARAGHFVCAADIRGMGDMRPEVGRGNPAYTIPHDSEEEFAWASLILGVPMLAQRIVDICALIQALRNEPSLANRSFRLVARGRLCVPSLLAFHQRQEIASLYLQGGLVSFEDLLQTEEYAETLANFAWRLYEAIDLPLIANACAPRRIEITGAVDAAGRPASLSKARQLYPFANVTVSESQRWL